MDGNRHWIVHGHPLGLNSCKYARRAQSPRQRLARSFNWLQEVWVIQRFAAGSASISRQAIVPMEMPAPTAICLIHKSPRSSIRGSVLSYKLWLTKSFLPSFCTYAEAKLRKLGCGWRLRKWLLFLKQKQGTHQFRRWLNERKELFARACYVWSSSLLQYVLNFSSCFSFLFLFLLLLLPHGVAGSWCLSFVISICSQFCRRVHCDVCVLEWTGMEINDILVLVLYYRSL